MKRGFIYILTNKYHTVFYTGVTSNLSKRIQEHKSGKFDNAFTSKYNIFKLVYYEEFDCIESAIDREKQIKGGSRNKKMELINIFNPEWIEIII